MSRIRLLSASGKRMLFEEEGGLASCTALKHALVSSDLGAINLRGRIQFNDRNKKRVATDCMPIVGALSVMCVNEKAKKFFTSIDACALFSKIEVIDEATNWFVYTTASVVDAVVPGEGVQTLLDGKLRLKSPHFEVTDDVPIVFRLPGAYEASESLFCKEQLASTAKQFGLTGLSFWDFDSREETTLV